MKCLRKYQWVKLSRAYLPQGKGLMGHWAKLASRAAFRKGQRYTAAIQMKLSQECGQAVLSD